MRHFHPSPAAPRSSDDPQQQDLGVVAARKGVATACPGGRLPLIRQHRRFRRPMRVLTTRGGWTSAHHSIYQKEQRHVAASPQATTVISLDPPRSQCGSSRT
jgi:hypothetical protein